MLSQLLKISGWLLAQAPEWLLRPLAAILGDALLLIAPRRRRLILSNLQHAFPERPAPWHGRIARICSRRFVETGMLSLATPFLGERRIRSIARVAPSVEQWARRRESTGRATVFATLHLALWESQTWLKFLCPVPLPEFGIIFRPLDSGAADAYVKRTRERFGMRLLSRKKGFADALEILRGGGCLGLLFDQNAGMQGALTLLFDRVCSTSELPGLLARRFDGELRTFYPRRTAFWRVAFESDPIGHDGTAAGATLALNRWLEGALADEDLCASWLWVHDRWRHQDVPEKRLHLESKRDLLADDLRARGLDKLPRRTRVWVRLPNWLGDVVMALPLLRALRQSRPDAEITLVAHSRFVPLLSSWGVADAVRQLPRRGLGYFAHFRSLRRAYPDVWLLFTNSFRGDLEAWLTGCPQRFGLLRRGQPRPLLTHSYRVPPDFDECRHHQLKLWENFMRHFGLTEPLDRTPLAAVTSDEWRVTSSDRNPASASGSSHVTRHSSLPLGLIPGSENDPGKRWPVSGWRTLVEAFPGERFILFGTAADAPIANAIAAGFPPDRVENRVGKTDLVPYAEGLRSCRLLVTNDTGGMHLANALGVALIALFGPTNPVRTGPVFTAPCKILQPPGCPATGGVRLANLLPATVIAAVKSL